MDPFNQTIIEPHKGQPIVITNMKSMSFIIISMLNNVCKRYFSNISTCLYSNLGSFSFRWNNHEVHLESHRHDNFGDYGRS